MTYVYIIRCMDDTLYTGITSDIGKRIKQHTSVIKGGAKYTHSRGVKKTEALWQTESRSDALKLECAIKKLSRAKKEELIGDPQLLCTMFSDKLSEPVIRVADKDIPGVI